MNTGPREGEHCQTQRRVWHDATHPTSGLRESGLACAGYAEFLNLAVFCALCGTTTAQAGAVAQCASKGRDMSSGGDKEMRGRHEEPAREGPDIPFPFEPYDVQKQLMRKIYSTLEKGGIGIFESPTGTVSVDYTLLL